VAFFFFFSFSFCGPVLRQFFSFLSFRDADHKVSLPFKILAIFLSRFHFFLSKRQFFMVPFCLYSFFPSFVGFLMLSPLIFLPPPPALLPPAFPHTTVWLRFPHLSRPFPTQCPGQTTFGSISPSTLTCGFSFHSPSKFPGPPLQSTFSSVPPPFCGSFWVSAISFKTPFQN